MAIEKVLAKATPALVGAASLQTACPNVSFVARRLPASLKIGLPSRNFTSYLRLLPDYEIREADPIQLLA